MLAILEGSYAHHYTTNATMLAILNVQLIFWLINVSYPCGSN